MRSIGTPRWSRSSSFSSRKQSYSSTASGETLSLNKSLPMTSSSKRSASNGTRRTRRSRSSVLLVTPSPFIPPLLRCRGHSLPRRRSPPSQLGSSTNKSRRRCFQPLEKAGRQKRKADEENTDRASCPVFYSMLPSVRSELSSLRISSWLESSDCERSEQAQASRRAQVNTEGGHEAPRDKPSRLRWRNWYTHQLEVLAGAIPWRFESSPEHQYETPSQGVFCY